MSSDNFLPFFWGDSLGRGDVAPWNTSENDPNQRANYQKDRHRTNNNRNQKFPMHGDAVEQYIYPAMA